MKRHFTCGGGGDGIECVAVDVKDDFGHTVHEMYTFTRTPERIHTNLETDVKRVSCQRNSHKHSN